MTHQFRRLAMLFAVAILAAFLAPSGASAASDAQGNDRQSYIVVFKDPSINSRAEAARLARAHNGEVGFVYEHALKGFSVTLAPQAALALGRNPNVAFVEPDREVSLAAQETPTGIRRMFGDPVALDIDSTDDKRVDVDVAVIDTGIDWEHPDLNVVGGITCSGRLRATCDSNGDDDHYHGTHVAGTVAALDNDQGVVGVAPGARLWAVKVLDRRGNGSEAAVVAGIDWVAARADTIEVANMSLGGLGISRAEYAAIDGAVKAGVAFSVAAGNDSADANDYSPASFDNVLTVSALADFDGAPGGSAASTCRADEDDTLANFSNWGSVVDIAAPGTCITSTYPLEKGGYGTISGTSMASPHAAGALALLASNNNPSSRSDVYGLYAALTGSGNFNWTDDSGDGVKEPLLDISSAAFTPTFVDNTTPPPPPPPTGDLQLSVRAYKVKGILQAELSWANNSTNVDIYRNGSRIAANVGGTSYVDDLGIKGSGSRDYKVCNTGTTTCSAVVTAVW